METYDFSPNISAYSAVESLSDISESGCSNDIFIMDDAPFELLPSDGTMDGFDQQLQNSSENRMWPPQYNSAFSAYKKSHSNAAADSFVSCETLHKRCFRFLKKIDEDRKLEIKRSSLIAPAIAHNNSQELKSKKKDQTKSSFNHRRVKLKEHFENLYSLLPRCCKKDKHTILTNTTSYLRELKLRLCELEQQNETVDESTTKNFSNSEGGSGGFESHDKPFNSYSPLLYIGDDVILEQCEDIPCQVKIIINVQRNMISSPSTLLIKVIDLLSAEQLDLLSLSHKKGFGLEAIFVVLPKGDDWDVPHWQKFGSSVSRSIDRGLEEGMEPVYSLSCSRI